MPVMVAFDEDEDEVSDSPPPAAAHQTTTAAAAAGPRTPSQGIGLQAALASRRSARLSARDVIKARDAEADAKEKETSQLMEEMAFMRKELAKLTPPP